MYPVVLLLLAGVIFVNGWTDAPNAITCVVSTGVMSWGKAVRMAAVCNLLGILVMSLLSVSVADTIGGLVHLGGVPPDVVLILVCAALVAIILFAVAAWYFGIPTSETHALVAALTGAALAGGTLERINTAAWVRVLWGLALSVVLGLSFGWLVTRLLAPSMCQGTGRAANLLQVLSAVAMAFMHGAQDGQKFLGVYLLLHGLNREAVAAANIERQNNLPVLLICGLLMALGTLTGGRRIVECVGGRMVALQRYQGAGADLGGAVCLLLASLLGMPMSTTHAKTTAVMGAGLAASGTPVNRSIMLQMLGAWLFTFPVCGAIGYLVANVFLCLWSQ